MGAGYLFIRVLATLRKGSQRARLDQKSEKIERSKEVLLTTTAAVPAEAGWAAPGWSETRAETEKISMEKKTKLSKMVDKKGTQQSSGEGTTTIPSQNFQRITAMLKSKSVSEWKGQHPSFENFSVLAADRSKTGGKKGDDTQQRVMARYVASNTDKIIG